MTWTGEQLEWMVKDRMTSLKSEDSMCGSQVMIDFMSERHGAEDCMHEWRDEW